MVGQDTSDPGMPPIPADRLLPAPTAVTHELAWWGMSLVCLTEATFFACAIASYFYLSGRSLLWPPAAFGPPTLKLPSIMTACLVVSSITLVWAERGISRGQRGRLYAGLGATILLGLIFLALQYREYHEKLRHFVPQTHAYAATFYTITGVHGVHVAFGLLMLAVIAARALRGHFGVHRSVAVSTAALYWHFVDGVWLVIFTTLYLFPHVGR